jgi:hypothetical protein
MSEIITMSITAVALQLTGVTLCTAGRILEELLRDIVSPEAQTAFRELTASVNSETKMIEPEAVGQQPAQQIRAKRLSDLAAVAGLAIDDPERLRQRLKSVPANQWPDIVREVHRETFTRHVTGAAMRTCKAIGFDRVEKMADGRVVAEDSGGRALVVEVNSNGCLKAEVLGVADGSCRRILDAFIQALGKEGVNVRVENRRWTGGAPQLATGWKWVKRRVTPSRIRSQSQQKTSRVGPRPKARTNIGGT